MSQSLNERSAHPTVAQTEMLLHNLELNPEIAKGFLRTQHARQRSKTFWEQMQIQLNSVGGGAIKSGKQWMKYWTDKKSATKKKAALRAANRRRTGGGAGMAVELTAVEKRILAILGGETFATGDSSLRIPLIHEIEPSDTPRAPDMLEFAVVAETEAETEPLLEVDFMNQNTTCEEEHPKLTCLRQPSPLSVSAMESLPSSCAFYYTDYRETLDSLPLPPVHVLDTSHAESHTRSQIAITGAESASFIRQSPLRMQTPSPRRQRTSVPHQRVSATNSPRRRRRIRSSPPPSQRQSQFARTTERFLRLEERRMEMEAQNASLLRALLERTAQREHTLLEALTNVGNLLIQQQSQHNEHHSRQNEMMTEALRTEKALEHLVVWLTGIHLKNKLQRSYAQRDIRSHRSCFWDTITTVQNLRSKSHNSKK